MVTDFDRALEAVASATCVGGGFVFLGVVSKETYGAGAVVVRRVVRRGKWYRVPGICFAGNADSPDGRLWQWWTGKELPPLPRWYAVRSKPGRESEVEDDVSVACAVSQLFPEPDPGPEKVVRCVGQ